MYPGPYRIKCPNRRYSYYWMHNVHVEKTYGSVRFSYLDVKGNFTGAYCDYFTFINQLEESNLTEYRIFKLSPTENIITFNYNKDNLYGYIEFQTLSEGGSLIKLKLQQDSFYKNSMGFGMDAWYEEQTRNI